MSSICAGCSITGEFNQKCSICIKENVTSLFCSNECYLNSWIDHKKLHSKVLKPKLYLSQSSLPILMTEGCKINLQTKRLNLRPVEFSDASRIGLIKSEELVNKTQMYGSPSKSMGIFFTEGYIFHCLPVTGGSGQGGFKRGGRLRNVWGLVPRSDLGSEEVKGRKSEARREMDASGYVGNIAIAIDETRSTKSLYLRDGKEFIYPTALQLKNAGVTASVFYEIHPSFWNQGLMTEAITIILHYAFTILLLPSIIIDPRIDNPTSIHLAQKFHAVFIQQSFKHRFEQAIFRIDRDDWLARQKESGNEIFDREGRGGKRVCRWCMVPSRPAEVDCGTCTAKWAWYCSKECRNADLRFVGGHVCS